MSSSRGYAGLGMGIRTPRHRHARSALDGEVWTPPTSDIVSKRTIARSVSTADLGSTKCSASGKECNSVKDPTYYARRDSTPLYSVALRSARGMQGLTLAEHGGAMVELDVCRRRGSGVKAGQQIVPGLITPGGSSTQGWNMHPQLGPREPLLLDIGAPTTSQMSNELKAFLGNTKSRVSTKPIYLSPPRVGGMPHAGDIQSVMLEAARSHPRVQVDILLGSEVAYEGGYLWGHVRVHVHGSSEDDEWVRIAGGTIRVVGFEAIGNRRDRFLFYHSAASLADVSTSINQLYISRLDEEGYGDARCGTHNFPFAMPLAPETSFGTPKGVFSGGGLSVRCIAMISFKIKDIPTGKHAIAHFYRHCQIWPMLDAAKIMTPLEHRVETSVSKSLGSGRVHLRMSVQRRCWVAGQRCSVQVYVANDGKRPIKRLRLALVQTQTVFLYDPQLDYDFARDSDPDACQTKTNSKVIRENVLVAGERGSTRHASGRGWWGGVGSSESTHVSHSILLPTGALTVSRGRLLEVNYHILVSIGAGTLLGAQELVATLPITIINFASLELPPEPPKEHLVDCQPKSHTDLETPRQAGPQSFLYASCEASPLHDSGELEILRTQLERSNAQEETHTVADGLPPLDHDVNTRLEAPRDSTGTCHPPRATPNVHHSHINHAEEPLIHARLAGRHFSCQISAQARRPHDGIEGEIGYSNHIVSLNKVADISSSMEQPKIWIDHGPQQKECQEAPAPPRPIPMKSTFAERVQQKMAERSTSRIATNEAVGGQGTRPPFRKYQSDTAPAGARDIGLSHPTVTRRLTGPRTQRFKDLGVRGVAHPNREIDRPGKPQIAGGLPTLQSQTVKPPLVFPSSKAQTPMPRAYIRPPGRRVDTSNRSGFRSIGSKSFTDSGPPSPVRLRIAELEERVKSDGRSYR